jgi:RNA polymerase sigma factor (sigma-70 family)
MTSWSTTMTISTADFGTWRGYDDAAYRDLRARLRAFIARRVENPEAAEDLTQEVLLRLVRSNPDDLIDPTAWLYRVARNVIVDHYRARRPAMSTTSDPEAPADTVDDPFADDPTRCPPRAGQVFARPRQPAARALPFSRHRRRSEWLDPGRGRSRRRRQHPRHEVASAARPPPAA